MKRIKVLGLLSIVSGLYVSAQTNSANLKANPGEINVAVNQQFNMFNNEMQPLEGDLKNYHDDYCRKNKTQIVPPTLSPTPIIYDKVINDLSGFYKKIIVESELTSGKINFSDTVQLLCYINSKGKVTSGYALIKTTSSGYEKVLQETSNIESWSPAYFGKTPGDVKATIQIVITDK